MIENFKNLPFERKVDVLVAEHIFKYTDVRIQEIIDDGGKIRYWSVMRKDGAWDTNIPAYSMLLTSAWDIVRKFDYLYLFRGGKNWQGGKWECKLLRKDISGLYGWAETEQLAICYAGLKAVEYPLKDFLKEEGK